MNKLIVLAAFVFTTSSFAESSIEDLSFTPENKEWCAKSKEALTKAGFEKMFSDKITKREEAEIYGTFFHLKYNRKCATAECDSLSLLYSSYELFCKTPYLEFDKALNGMTSPQNSKEFKFLYQIVGNPKRPGVVVQFMDAHTTDKLKLSPEEKNIYYYTTNGKKYGEKDYKIYQIPEISRIKKAVDEYRMTGFLNEFYGESGIDKPMEKIVEFEYPPMSGKSIEEAKLKRKQLLDGFKRTLVNKIKNDFVYNLVLKNFASNYLPVPISSQDGDALMAKLKDVKKTLFPVPVEDLDSERSDYVLEKYYNPTKSYSDKEISFMELTDIKPGSRYGLFGEYLLANSTFDFERSSENKVTVKIKIDLPNVSKTYGKKLLSEFLVK